MFRHKLIYLFSVFSVFLNAQEGINQYDREKQRHGPWKVHFEGTNQIKFEGNFVHGEETGEFKFYKEGFDEHPSAIIHFEKDGFATATYYSQKGKPISRGKLKNKEREGEWVYFHNKSEDTMMVENYTNGKLQGIQKTYFPNGELAEKTEYREGKKHGESFIYSDSGKLLQHFTYKNDEFHGPAIYYNAKGEKTIEGEYYEDRKTGTWKYYENGNLDEEKEY